MGCYEVTCGITSMPIFEGDPCVMVLFKNHFVEKSMNAIWRHHDIVKHIEMIDRGIYDDYGWLKNLPMPDEHSYAQMVIFFHQDVWDQCSAMYLKNTVDLQVRPRDIFGDKWLFDEIFSKKKQEEHKHLGLPELEELIEKENPVTSLHREFFGIVGYARDVRRDILSSNGMTSQDFGKNDERDLMLKLSLEHQADNKKRWEN